jgi:hypothetical protein
MRCVRRSIPPSLLLLSRAFKLAGVKKDKKKDAKAETVESLRNTFNMLPEETLEGVEMETFKSSASPQKRLEFLQREEQEIKDENALEESEELADAREALEVCAMPPQPAVQRAAAACTTLRTAAAQRHASPQPLRCALRHCGRAACITLAHTLACMAFFTRACTSAQHQRAP